jgi:hypothetical protein
LESEPSPLPVEARQVLPLVEKTIKPQKPTPSPSPIKPRQQEWKEVEVEVSEDPQSRKKHYRINMMKNTPAVI